MGTLRDSYQAGVKHAIDLSSWLKSSPTSYEKPSSFSTAKKSVEPYVSTKGVSLGDTGLSVKPKWGSTWGASLSGRF